MPEASGRSIPASVTGEIYSTRIIYILGDRLLDHTIVASEEMFKARFWLPPNATTPLAQRGLRSASPQSYRVL